MNSRTSPWLQPQVVAMFIAGALVGRGAASDTSFQYDVNGTTYEIMWQDAAPMPVPTSDATATTVGDRIYVVGGCDSAKGNEKVSADLYSCMQVADQLVVYDPQANFWITASKMPEARYRHAAAAVGSDIYVIGGRNVQDAIVQTVLKYNTVTNSWSTVVSNFPEATSDNAAFAHGTNVYVCGGYLADYSAASRDCYVMDTTSSSPSFQDTGFPMFQGRGDFSIVSLGSSAYLVGGFSSSFSALSSAASMALPVQQGWRHLNGMVHGRGDFAAVAFKGRLLVMGGENGTDALSAGAGLRHVEAYMPEAEAWLGPRETAPIPYATFRFCAAAYGDSVYIFGGQQPWDSSCDCYPTRADVFSYTERSNVAVGASSRWPAFSALWVALALALATVVPRRCLLPGL